MGEVAGAGRTVLFVSHNMAAVESLCNVTCLLADGRVLQQGATRTVIQYVSQIGSPGGLGKLEGPDGSSKGPEILVHRLDVWVPE